MQEWPLNCIRNAHAQSVLVPWLMHYKLHLIKEAKGQPSNK